MSEDVWNLNKSKISRNEVVIHCGKAHPVVVEPPVTQRTVEQIAERNGIETFRVIKLNGPSGEQKVMPGEFPLTAGGYELAIREYNTGK